MVRTFWPPGFWSSLKMTHDIQWLMIARYLTLIAVVLYASLCLSHGAIVSAVMRVGGPWVGQAMAAPGWVPPPARVVWADLVTAVVLPLSETPLGAFGRTSRDLFVASWTGFLGTLLLISVMHLLCAVGFLALPVSRRIAMVRWGHIARIGAYGVMLAVPYVLLTLVGAAVRAQPPAWTAGTAVLWLALVCGFAIVPLEVVWWSTATGRYFRIPHPWGVGSSLVAMAFLATLLLIGLVLAL